MEFSNIHQILWCDFITTKSVEMTLTVFHFTSDISGRVSHLINTDLIGQSECVTSTVRLVWMHFILYFPDAISTLSYFYTIKCQASKALKYMTSHHNHLFFHYIFEMCVWYEFHDVRFIEENLHIYRYFLFELISISISPHMLMMKRMRNSSFISW